MLDVTLQRPSAEQAQAQSHTAGKPFWRRLGRLAANLFPRLVGALLLAAAMEKAWTMGWENSQLKEVLRFDGFSEYWVERLARTVLVTEGIVGTLLLLGMARPLMVQVASAVLVVFTAQLGYLLLFKQSPNCGCLSLLNAFAEERHNTMVGVARNLVMIAGLQWAYFAVIRHEPAEAADRLPLEDALR